MKLEDCIQDYLIIRITNLKKKKKKYHFGYSSLNGSTLLKRKEYNMLETY